MPETAYRLAKAKKRPIYNPPEVPLTLTYLRFEKGLHEYYRAALPLLKLREHGLAGCLTTDEAEPEERLDKSQVVLISRPNQENELEAIKELQRADKTVVLDTDDYPHLLYQISDHLARIWDKDRLDCFEECVRAVDAVTVSVLPLAERMVELGAKRVTVLDNSLDPRSLRWDVPWPEDDGKIRIGWMAGFTHMRDAAVLEKPIVRVLEKHPEAVFKTVGYMPPWVVKLNPDQLEVGRTVTLLNFAEGLVGIHIALGPLEPMEFNKYRSSVKCWEAICAGSVFVASNYGPYQRDLKHEKTAYLCETEEDWVDALSTLIESEKKRRDLWRSSFKAMIKRSIDWTVPAYYLTYQEAFLHSESVQTMIRRRSGQRLWQPTILQ